MGVTYMMACGTERVKNVFSYQKRCTIVSAILQLNQGIRSTSHKIEEKLGGNGPK
jgi:hypothetical protein